MAHLASFQTEGVNTGFEAKQTFLLMPKGSFLVKTKHLWKSVDRQRKRIPVLIQSIVTCKGAVVLR